MKMCVVVIMTGCMGREVQCNEINSANFSPGSLYLT